jgi:DNA invertase Pin-like site-specific DNA recombinase
MNIPAVATTERTVTEIPSIPRHTERDIRKQQLGVAAYCRVSTDSEDQLNSYHSQINYYTTVINENPNWKMAGIFADEGLSGVSTKKRKQFNLMMEKCKKGKIDLIIVKSISRFARNTLDSLSYARKLKKKGIGILFEKESINTLEMDDETIFIIFSSLAQAESESLSRNVAMGYHQSFKAGTVHYRYKNFLGYRKGEDGNPEIVPREAEIVRRIFHRYLSGDSVAQICRDLTADHVPTMHGTEEWYPNGVRYMLRNEKYMGDALLQKTYVVDLLTHTRAKNNGVLPQYYVSNSHPAIIERDVFQKVQEEIARRGCKRKTPAKNARTEQSKYSGKYALNEILVCGECGTPYRRVTWARGGVTRIVWRCVSRLEHGKQFCKQSPTLYEDKLHAAIMGAVSDSIGRTALLDALKSGVVAAACADSAAMTYLAAKRRAGELDILWSKTLEQSVRAGSDEDYYGRKLKAISDELAEVRQTIGAYEAAHTDGGDSEQLAAAAEILDAEPLLLTEYDDRAVRQLVDTIRVMGGGRLRVTLKGGDTTEIEMEL